MSSLIIKPRSRIFHGHDWVYGTEVVKTIGQPLDGEVVTLKEKRGRILGSAIYNSQSQIVARRISRQAQKLDLDFFIRRIEAAVDYRQRRGILTPVSRIVWSESDGLPGVIIDRYNDAVVIQLLTLAMDQCKSIIVEAILQVLKPNTIIERNDAPVRRAEGMELTTGILHGNDPGEISIEIQGITFSLDLLNGQKTGFYLDQVDAYQRVASYAQDRRVLDCFSNQGAFALSCAKAGATRVKALEISDTLVSTAERNASANGVDVEFEAVNVFDYLKAASQREEESYDLIILDPPSFTRSKGKSRDAMRGYKEIHLRALHLLKKDGILATFSCSHHISEKMFMDTIVDAAVDAKRNVRLLERVSQAQDHPILPHIPETEYLKGFILERMPGR